MFLWFRKPATAVQRNVPLITSVLFGEGGEGIGLPWILLPCSPSGRSIMYATQPMSPPSLYPGASLHMTGITRPSPTSNKMLGWEGLVSFPGLLHVYTPPVFESLRYAIKNWRCGRLGNEARKAWVPVLGPEICIMRFISLTSPVKPCQVKHFKCC